MLPEKSNSEILLYQSEDGQIKIQVRLDDHTVWLTQADMVELFQSSKSNISEHIKHIFEEGELSPDSTVRRFRTVRTEGTRKVEREIEHYNLDVIISVGYRVKSLRGTQFRIWATERLREYLIKGFTMNDDLLKQGGGYFEELLERIRDIRSSEKIFYRKVLEIYATSIDYDPRSEMTQKFFQTVQNKLHWAAHGHTAAEIIFERAKAESPFMGLTLSKVKNQPNRISRLQKLPYRRRIGCAERLVSAYLDIAEVNALQRKPMYYEGLDGVLDGFIKMSRQDVLTDAGKISAELAQRKALAEYEAIKSKLPTNFRKSKNNLLPALNKPTRNLKH
jgi:hypothetical protein